MPLIQGRSKKALGENIKAEMHAGKPQKQSIAIAYSIQRKNKKKKMAYGGKAEDTNEPAVPQAKSDDERLPKEEYMADHFAYGGKAEDDGEPAMPKAKPDDKRPAEDEYMSGDFKSEPGSSPRKPDDKRLPKEEYMADHFSKGGDVEDHYASIADAILAKKRKKMSDGGQVDLDENAQEDLNNLDDMNFEAARKENYSEEHGLSALNEPEDSNEHGHKLPDEDEHDMASSFEKDIDHKQHDSIDPEDHDEHDMVESIRKKLKSKRGF